MSNVQSVIDKIEQLISTKVEMHRTLANASSVVSQVSAGLTKLSIDELGGIRDSLKEINTAN